MNKETEYRKDILLTMNTFLQDAAEHVTKRPLTPSTNSLKMLIGNMGLLVTTLTQLDDEVAFQKVVFALAELLEDKFFSQIHGKREEKTKLTTNPFATKEETKPTRPTQVSDEENGIYATIIGLDDPDSIPMEVRLKLAQALTAMGLNKDQINERLNLGGNN